MAKQTKVYILMFDEDGSGDKGDPMGVFYKMPRMEDLLDWVDVEDVHELKQNFNDGSLWFKTTTIE